MARLRVKWIIHSTFLLTYEGEETVKILIDPFLEPLGDKKEEVLNELSGIDLVLVTHSHFDHMGNVCDVLSKNPSAKCVGIFEIANHIQEKCGGGNEAIGMNIGGTWIYEKNGFKLPITLVHSTHSSDIGAPTGFIIRFPGFPVYHPGDTGLFSDMELFGKLYNIKLSLLPIGSHFTMGIDEAVEATRLLNTEYVIPMHYKTFPVIDADPVEFKKKVGEKSGAKAVIISPGEEYTFEF